MNLSTTANTVPKSLVNRPNMVSIGTVIWLASELMFFAGLFAMYFSIRAACPSLWNEETRKLNVLFAFINTVILVLSSFTCQMSVISAEKMRPYRKGSIFNVYQWGVIEWLYLTTFMGATFIFGQIIEYINMMHEQIKIDSNAYSSIFYFTTGFHGIHVIGGLIAFMFVARRIALAKKFSYKEITSTIVVSYYWHFVDVVWIALFAVIYFLK